MEYATCDQCGKELEPHSDDYTLLDHQQEITYHGRGQHWVQDTVMIQCAYCGNVIKMSDGYMSSLEDDE